MNEETKLMVELAKENARYQAVMRILLGIYKDAVRENRSAVIAPEELKAIFELVGIKEKEINVITFSNNVITSDDNAITFDNCGDIAYGKRLES